VYTKGSTSGVVEAYMLSSFGRIPNVVYDEIVYQGTEDANCVLGDEGFGDILVSAE